MISVYCQHGERTYAWDCPICVVTLAIDNTVTPAEIVWGTPTTHGAENEACDYM